MEHVLGELGQLAHAIGGVVAHQERRVDLGVAALFRRVQVEHELGDGSLQAREVLLQEYEARAGDLGGRREIHLAGRLAQRHMVFGLEGEVALAADAADLHVGGLVHAIGHVVERQVGQHLQAMRQLLVEAGGFGLALLQGRLEGRDLGHQRLGWLALALGDADLAAQRLALGLRRLALGDGGAAALVDLQQLGRQGREIALLQASVERSGVLPDETDVMHGQLPAESVLFSSSSAFLSSASRFFSIQRPIRMLIS
jgi:hypothetical protein